jgi:hypothetical protein
MRLLLLCRSDLDLYHSLEEFLQDFPDEAEFPYINFTEKEKIICYTTANFTKVFCRLLESKASMFVPH